MNRKRATFALGAACALALLGFTAQPAFATDDCVAVNSSPGAWPEANSAKTCFSATQGALMRGALETIGADDTDAASRLKNALITPNETVGVTITDSWVPGGSVQVQYTTKSYDSATTVASKLAAAINSTNTGGAVYAYATGATVNIYSFTSSTSYSDLDGTNVTIDLQTISSDTTKATLIGQPRTNITWYEFANHSDYTPGTVSGGPIISSPGLTTGDFGVSVTSSTSSTRESMIFESDGSTSNPGIKHTTAHETGHQYDYLLGATVLPSNDASPAGTPDPGKTLSITVTDSGVTGSPVTVSYEIQSTDTTLADVADGFATAINANSALQSAGITALAWDGQVTLTSTTGNGTTYTRNWDSGSTTTLSSGTFTRGSEAAAFQKALKIDREGMNSSRPCGFEISDPDLPMEPSVQHDGLFAGMVDKNGSFICSGTYGTESPPNGYSGSNLSIALQAWPRAYRNEDSAELFAEEFSMAVGFRDTLDDNGNEQNGSNFAFYGTPYICTMRVVESLVRDGKLPDDLQYFGYEEFHGTTNEYTFHKCDGTSEEREVSIGS